MNSSTKVNISQLLLNSRMSDEQIENALNPQWLIENLLHLSRSIILYGDAGSGKTTIMLHFCTLIAREYKTKTILYLYLDGEHTLAARYNQFLKSENLDDRVFLLVNESIDKLMPEVHNIIDASSNPEDIVVVLDTYKHLNPNMLNKTANAKALHSIKEKITSKGTSMIMLHHTNKNDSRYAGTAELEQDVDALLRIDTIEDPNDKEYKLSSIEVGGRCRYSVEPRTYRFKPGAPESVKEEEYKSINDIKEMNRYSSIIQTIKEILESNGEMTKTGLVDELTRNDCIEVGKNKIFEIIRTYSGDLWKVEKKGRNNGTHYLSLIEENKEDS